MQTNTFKKMQTNTVKEIHIDKFTKISRLITFMFRDVVTDTMRLLMTCTLELLCRPGRRRRGWTLPSGLWHARWVHIIGEVQDSWHGADHWTVKHHHSMRLCPIHLAFVRLVLAAFPSVRPVSTWDKNFMRKSQKCIKLYLKYSLL